VAEVRVVDSASRRVPRAAEITRLLLSLIESARREVLIVSPYLVLGESTAEALSRASERGVRITLLTNSPRSSDSTISQAFFTEQWPVLLARVPGARLYVAAGDDTLHAKLATVDDRVAVIGTYNLDPIAMRFDSELAVAIWSPRVSAALRRYAATWIDRGPPLAFEYRIERDGEGQAVRDDHGEPVIAFGPEEHVDPERLAGVARQRRWLARLRWLLGLEPLLRSESPDGAPPVSRARGAPSP
jgi:phosphatidylserine/phosphatidylglycerophosphate/cardiolipin synthase-like enzyme